MLFKCAIFSALLGFAAASPAVIDELDGLPANSDLGNKLLSKARRLSNDNDYDEMSWVAGYDIKFVRCRHQVGFGNYGGGDDGGQSGMYVQRFAEFRLCPSGSCYNKCPYGATYVVDLGEFVQSYMESLRQIREAKCEAIRESCENYQCNGDDNDDGCVDACVASAGMYECVEDEEDGNNDEEEGEFDMQCVEVERGNNDDNDDGNNNNNRRWYNWWSQYQSYTCYNENCNLFVGPYCSTNGKKVYMGAFIDETCSQPAPKGTYESYNFGQTLKYSDTPLVNHTCISCDMANNTRRRLEDGDDEEDQLEIMEMCGGLYEDAFRCEENMTIDYPDTSGCDYVMDYLPLMDSIYRSKQKQYAATMYYGAAGIVVVVLGALGARKYKTRASTQEIELGAQDYTGGVMS